MMSGMTVFYRLSEENVWDIEHMRDLTISVQEYDITENVRFFHGAPVEIGMMCPAEVFKAYSLYENCAENNLMLPEGVGLAEGRNSFSGYADLRVKLPGNDILWVPRAEYDPSPQVAPKEDTFGIGTNVLPEIGKFTPVLRPSLTY